MADEWVNIRTERNPKYEHIHEDDTSHETQRTIPIMSVESVSPGEWRASFLCDDCRATYEVHWAA
jgi:hypothetical protein